MSWRFATLADVLHVSSTVLSIREDVRYQQVMLRPYPQGLVLKAVKSGLEFPKKRQKLVRSGQFVISRTHTRRNLWGIVPPPLDGAVLSYYHLIFNLHPDLNPDYFAAYLAAPMFKQAVLGACGGSRNRLLLQEFQRIALPLPPADIQAAIAEVWRYANAARTHTAEMFTAIAEAKAGVTADWFRETKPSWERRTLGECAQIGRGLAGEVVLTVISADQIVLGEVEISENTVGIVPGIELDGSYLYYLLEHQKAALRSQLSAAAPRFEVVLQALPLAVPTLYEQRKIAAILQQHDETLLRIKAEQTALRKLTQGIMQSIFSGTLNLEQIIPLLRQFTTTSAPT